MRKRLVSKLAVAILGVSVALAGIGGVESAHAAGKCPNNNWSNIDKGRAKYFQKNGVNIRTGNKKACRAVGQGQRSHVVVLHCARHNGTWWWWHLRDVTTGVSGWVRMDQLTVEHVTRC